MLRRWIDNYNPANHITTNTTTYEKSHNISMCNGGLDHARNVQLMPVRNHFIATILEAVLFGHECSGLHRAVAMFVNGMGRDWDVSSFEDKFGDESLMDAVALSRARARASEEQREVMMGNTYAVGHGPPTGNTNFSRSWTWKKEHQCSRSWSWKREH